MVASAMVTNTEMMRTVSTEELGSNAQRRYDLPDETQLKVVSHVYCQDVSKRKPRT